MNKPHLLSLVFFAISSGFLFAAPAGDGVLPEEALAKLKSGNYRFVVGEPRHPNMSIARRKETAKGQKPFAVVVSCSDSRCAPEQLFDQGIGDLFVTRLAGNLVDDPALGSIEFAVAKLGARLIVVLGHNACGAVDAAVKGGKVPGKIGVLTKAIKPAVKAAAKKEGDVLHNAIEINAQEQVKKLKASTVLAPKLSDGSIRIVAATYDMASGVVTFLK